MKLSETEIAIKIDNLGRFEELVDDFSYNHIISQKRYSKQAFTEIGDNNEFSRQKFYDLA